MKIMMIKYYDQIRAWVTYIYGGSILGVTCIYIYTCYTDISTCSSSSRRRLVQEDKRMVLEYTHGLFIT